MEFIEALRAIVGAPQVLTDPGDTAPHYSDARKQYSIAAECVVRPASAAEVSAVIRLCAREGVGVIPQGGNTGLSGGSVPTGERREIVLALGRMNRIREIDALNDTMTVEAGCVLAAIQQAAERAGRFFPLSLGAEGSCQIGGNLSTNAGGVNVLRYGNARAQALGLEVVLPDGRIWDGLRGLRKDNTGYSLKELFLGAEGTLGIITAAVLKLHPLPTAGATAWIGVDSPAAAVALLGRLRELTGERISAFELISRACLQAVLAWSPATVDPLPAAHPWYVLADFADSGASPALRELVERALSESEQGKLLRDATLAQSEAQAKSLWRIRHSIPEAQFSNVKHDVSVAVSRIPQLIERLEDGIAREFPQSETYAFGHVGDGNLHYNVGPKALIARRPEVNRVVYDAVDALGGSISAEHGLGQLKRDEILRHKDPLEMELMRSLKRTLDPGQIMNPGKVL
jgi:FAD/FMN-containing dehydrogenase